MNINSRNKRINVLWTVAKEFIKGNESYMTNTNLFENYPDILTGEQVQEILGIRRTTYYSLIDTEANKDKEYTKIPVFKIGTKVKVLKKDLIGYVLSLRGGNNDNETK